MDTTGWINVTIPPLIKLRSQPIKYYYTTHPQSLLQATRNKSVSKMPNIQAVRLHKGMCGFTWIANKTSVQPCGWPGPSGAAQAPKSKMSLG